VDGTVSFKVCDKGRGDRFVVDRDYTFLGFRAKTAGCDYENEAQAKAGALNDCVSDLQGWPQDETHRRLELLYPHKVVPAEPNGNTMSVRVIKNGCLQNLNLDKA
jgi:hypothetical protein